MNPKYMWIYKVFALPCNFSLYSKKKIFPLSNESKFSKDNELNYTRIQNLGIYVSFAWKLTFFPETPGQRR